MLEGCIAKSDDPEFLLKVLPGDGICLSLYEPEAEAAIVRAIGFVFSDEESARHTKVKWAKTDLLIIPAQSERASWAGRLFFQIADAAAKNYGLPSAFAEHFPGGQQLTQDSEGEEVVTYLWKPDKYFRLDVGGGASVSPSLLAHLGRIHTGAEWEVLGFNPYEREILNSRTHCTAYGFGSFKLNGSIFGFTPMVDLPEDLLKLREFKPERTSLKEWTKAIKDRKRHVSVPADVVLLRRQGVPYDEISNITEFTIQYSEGCLAMERMDYDAAASFFRTAVQLKPDDIESIRLLFESRLKLGDLTVIEEGLAFYFNDMHVAVYCGDAEKWLRAAIDIAIDYRIVFDIVLRIVDRLDALICDRIEKKQRVYGTQRADYYKESRAKFIKRLGTLRGFLKSALIEANRDRAEQLEGLLTQIALSDSKKVPKIEKLLALLKA